MIISEENHDDLNVKNMNNDLEKIILDERKKYAI